MTIKLVVSDIDGTLLGPSGVPTVRTLRALRRVREAGVTVALATARRWSGCSPAAEALEMAGPLILYDGALTCSFPDRKILDQCEIGRDQVQLLCERLADAGLRPFAQYFSDEGESLVTPEWPEEDSSLGYLNMFRHQVSLQPLRRLHTQAGSLLRVVAFGSADALRQVAAEATNPAVESQILYAGNYGPDELTFFQAGVSKGSGLQALAERLGIGLDETLAIGDGLNDLSMLRIAGTSVAMGQAWPQVKAAAQRETARCDQDGAALALEKHVLGLESSGTHQKPSHWVTDDPDELLDLVDEDDCVIGTVKRGEANRNPALIHRSVEVFVLTSRGAVLLQRRSASKDLYPGMLCASASGHVSAGQTYDEAAHTELREELGIRAEITLLGKCLVRAETETEITAVYVARHDGPFTYSPIESSGGLEVPLGQFLDSSARSMLGVVPAIEAGVPLLAAEMKIGSVHLPDGAMS